MLRRSCCSRLVLPRAGRGSAEFCLRRVVSERGRRGQRLFAPFGILALSATIGLCVFLSATTQIAWASTIASATALSKEHSHSDTAQLRERVEQWWTARKHGDHRMMYELYSPQFRAQRPYESFVSESVARARIPLEGFDLVAFEAAGPERALAKLKLHLVVPMGRVTTDVEEDWMVSDGRWYKFYKPAVAPRPPAGMQGRIVVPDAMREQAAPAKPALR